MPKIVEIMLVNPCLKKKEHIKIKKTETPFHKSGEIKLQIPKPTTIVNIVIDISSSLDILILILFLAKEFNAQYDK